MDFPPLISVEEEAKTLEELKEILEDRLDKVNKRIEALKRQSLPKVRKGEKL
jgi:hypothetical protein